MVAPENPLVALMRILIVLLFLIVLFRTVKLAVAPERSLLMPSPSLLVTTMSYSTSVPPMFIRPV
jgi:hypothetical protein